MSTLRYLTEKELDLIVADVKYQKTELKNIIRTKAKVYKLTKQDITKLKKTLSTLMNEKNIPRYLSDEEIDSLVGNLPSCTKDVREFNREKILDSLKFDLSTFKICPSKKNLENIRKIIYETYLRSVCQAGDAVGSSGAMALGSSLTQATLDAFHSAGSGGKGGDAKYIDQLLYPNTKKATSSCNAHFKDKNLTKEEIIKSYTKKFKGISVEDLIISKEITDNVPKEDEIWYSNYMNIYGVNIKTTNKFLRVKINVYKCYTYGIKIKDISNIIEKTTKVQGGKKSIYCVSSSTDKGIIDIHVEEEFIRSSVDDFVTKGLTFKTCERRYRGKSIINEAGETQRTYLKTVLDLNTELSDLISVFLTVILESCFKDMSITGIKGAESISVVDNKLTSFLKFKKVFSDSDISKYTSKKYGVLPSEFFRLYYVYLDYYAINIIGIPVQKFIDFMETCGMELIDDRTEESKPKCVFLVPEMSDEMSDGKPKYYKKDGKIYDSGNGKEVITPEEPTKLLGRKLREAQDILREQILSSEEETEISEFPETYRYGIYCYLKVFGKDITREILRDKTVDPYFTCSNTVSDVMNYYGIESSRLFFIREYNTSNEIQKMNPVNIELLVDFQTTMGQILSVTSTDIAKHGKSALVAASFEQPLEAFKKSSSMGTTDIINNIPSCLMSGKRCTNGTGVVDIEFSENYKDNKFEESKEKTITLLEVEQKEIMGGCFAAGNFVKDSPEENEDIETKEALLQTEEMENPKKNFKGKARSLLREEVLEEASLPEVDIVEAEEDNSLLDI